MLLEEFWCFEGGHHSYIRSLEDPLPEALHFRRLLKGSCSLIVPVLRLQESARQAASRGAAAL